MLNELETRRVEFKADVSQWSVERLNSRPAPVAWSAVEMLDHIVRAESGTIADISNGLKSPCTLGEEPRPGVAALDRALRSEQTFQVPAGTGAIHPDFTSTLADVSSRWEHSRAELKALVESLRP